MFEYLKELLNEEIECDMQKYDEETLKKEEISNKLSMFSHFEDLRRDLKSYRILTKFFLIMSVITVGTVLFMNLNYIFGIIVIIFFNLKTVENSLKAKNVKPLLRDEEKKCIELAKTIFKQASKEVDINDIKLIKNELLELERILKTQQGIIECRINEIMNSIKINNETLKMLEQYEDDDKFFSTGDIGLWKTVKNRMEYVDITTKKEVFTSYSVDNYLEEAIDYSNIRFNNSIGESINYTENNKKLIKKCSIK